MDHKRDFSTKAKGIFRSSEDSTCERLGRDFSCLAERKMRKGITVVFRYVRAAIKPACSSYILWVEPEQMGLRLKKED